MNTTPIKLRADAQRNYELLVQVTKDAIAATGSIPALDFIARKAGVGIGTLYRHFPTRSSLLMVLYSDQITGLVTEATGLLGKRDMSPDQAVLIWLQKAVHYGLEDAGFNEAIDISIQDKQSPLLLAGSALLSRAQATKLFRADITVFDLLRFTNSITSDMSSHVSREKADMLVSMIVAGARSNPN